MGVAVVGFSLVVGILRPKSQDDEERLFTIRDVAEIGLICAVMSMVPAVVHSYGIRVELVWRMSSAIHLVWVAFVIPASARRRGFSALLPTVVQHWLIASLVLGMASLNGALAVTNLVSPSSYSGARYSTCMLLLLAQGGFMFLWAAFDLGRGKRVGQPGAAD